MGQGGAERVLDEILELYPAPIFTLFQSSKDGRKNVTHSFLQNLPFVETKYRNYLPLYPRAIEQFDLSEFDLIISNSHAVAKGVKTHAGQLHICNCCTPIRYAWDLEEQYLESVGALKGMIARRVLKYLRKWDFKSASRVDAFVAISHYVAERIKRIYGREAHVIYPPVRVENYAISEKKDDFYLSVGRLVQYKKVDLMVEAFNQMPEKRLKVVGTGPDLEKLKGMAGGNIEFLGFESEESVKQLLGKARGFVFAAEEDFGIAPVEAQASGTPVIAYGKGAALETIVDGTTGLFFAEQSAQSLIEAVKRFEKISWDGKVIRTHSEKFGVDRFRKEFREFVNQQWELFNENRHFSRR